MGEGSRCSLRSSRAVDAGLEMVGRRTDLLGLGSRFVGLRGLILGSLRSTVVLDGLLLLPMAFFIADTDGLAKIVPLDNLLKRPRSYSSSPVGGVKVGDVVTSVYDGIRIVPTVTLCLADDDASGEAIGDLILFSVFRGKE